MAERGHMAFMRGHHRWVLWLPKTLSAANKGIDKLLIGYLFRVVEILHEVRAAVAFPATRHASDCRTSWTSAADSNRGNEPCS